MNRTVCNSGITVKYIYSACVVTETPDLSILHDPWFTEGAYDGSWFHFPKVSNPIERIGDVDLIYVSHIHPDHYDPEFLKKYFAVYGKKKVVIANFSANHLSRKMMADGIEFEILKEPFHLGRTEISIVPHESGSVSDVDSALVLKYAEADKVHCVVNANDIIFDDQILNKLKCLIGKVDILLCGYTGAGPYPQTYYDLDEKDLQIEAKKKKEAFFARYRKTTDYFNAKVNIPFAGKYVLGGRLTLLNESRGVADAVEVKKFDPRAVVLDDAGGHISTADLQIHGERKNPYKIEDLRLRLLEIEKCNMDYENLFDLDVVQKLPMKRLLRTAYDRAQRRSECDFDYYFVIKLGNGERAILNANRARGLELKFIDEKYSDLPSPRSEISIDPRYLFGLLTGIYHWNNAEIGSQFETRRHPNVFNRPAQSFLNFLSVI